MVSQSHDVGSAPSLPYAPKTVKVGLVVLGIIVLIIVAVFYYKYAYVIPAAPVASTSSDTAEGIRNIFSQVPSSTPAGSHYAAAPTSGGGKPTPPPSAGATVQPRGEVLGLQSSPTPTSMAAAQNFVYTNPALNFQITFPAGWELESANDTQILFRNNSAQQFGYVEIHPNTTGETISSLRTELSNSQSVTSVQDTTLSGQPALLYQYNQSDQGIATVYNNEIYYLHGELVSADLTSGFRFLK